MESLSHQKGFTLTEMLVVIFIIGILAGTGAGYYAHMANEIRTQTLSESLSAFFSACRKRASMRGMEVKTVVSPRGVGILDSAALFLPLPKPAPETEKILANLTFCSSQTLLLGKPVRTLALEFFAPGGQPLRFAFDLTP